MRTITVLATAFFLTALLSHTGYTQDLSDGLVAYYPFNGNANDESVNGNHGTVLGAVLTTDRFGNPNSAYSLDGEDDYIVALHQPWLNLTGDFTLSVWALSDVQPTPNNWVIGKGASPGSHEYALYFSNGQNKPWASINSAAASNTQVGPNTLLSKAVWIHIAVVAEVGVLRLYVNGVETASGSFSYNPTANDLFIGRLGTQYYKGIIDDIRIYDRALAEAEVQDLCTEGGWGCDQLSPYLIIYYPFNASTDPSITIDESGNGHHATVLGATLTMDRFGNANSAYSFDGNTDYLDPSLPVFTAYAFSFCTWLNTSSLSTTQFDQVFFGGRTGFTTRLTALATEWQDQSSLYAQVDGEVVDRPTISTAISVHDNQWHLVCVTLGRDTFTMYLDAQIVGTDTEFDTGSKMTDKAVLGAYSDNDQVIQHFYAGILDDVRIYSRVLNEDEIQALFNQPPTADAGPDQTVECSGPVGAEVTLDGTASSDPDGDPLTYTWTDEDGNILGIGVAPMVTLPLGAHTITLTVDDGNGGTDAADVDVTIQDSTAPEITVAAGLLELWLPTHAYHTVSLGDIVTGVTDICDAGVSAGEVVVVSASSDEPENGSDDGNTTDDIVIAGDCASVDLRAERQGDSNGRVYAIHLAVPDASGNVGMASYQVHVPKSKKSGAVDDGPFYTVTGCETALLASVAEAGATQAVEGKLLEGQSAEIPAAYELAQNYPNPFNPSTEIQFTLPEATHVRLVVYNVMGREVAHLVEGSLGAGIHRVTFDASGLPSGVYLYRITAGSFTRTNRMVLTK